MFQKVFGVTVSHLDELQLSKNLRVNNSELIVDCLVKDHVIYMLIHWVSNRSKSGNAILDDGF